MKLLVFCCGLAAVLLTEAFGAGGKMQTIKEDFDKADSGWQIDYGCEYPGATGSVEVEKGADGNNYLKFTVDFSNGSNISNYVGAVKNFATPINLQKLSFKVKTAASRIGLRIVDSGEQTHQQYLILSGDRDSWQEMEITQLGGRQPGFVHWNGANDGVVRQPVKSMMFVVGNLDVAGEKWDTLIKQISYDVQ